MRASHEREAGKTRATQTYQRGRLGKFYLIPSIEEQTSRRRVSMEERKEECGQ